MNDVEQGQTPFTTELRWPNDNSVHTIMLDADDYERQERRLTHFAASDAPDPWEFDINLERLAQVFDVRIESSPSGASVRVNGRDLGTTPADRCKCLFESLTGVA